MQTFNEFFWNRQKQNQPPRNPRIGLSASDHWTAADDTLDVRTMVHQELIKSGVAPQALQQGSPTWNKYVFGMLKRFGNQHEQDILGGIADYVRGDRNSLHTAPYARP